MVSGMRPNLCARNRQRVIRQGAEQRGHSGSALLSRPQYVARWVNFQSIGDLRLVLRHRKGRIGGDQVVRVGSKVWIELQRSSLQCRVLVSNEVPNAFCTPAEEEKLRSCPPPRKHRGHG